MGEAEFGKIFLGVSSVCTCHKYHSTISLHSSHSFSFISFHLFRPCDGASNEVGRHPCYSLTFNIRTSSHLIPRPTLCQRHELTILCSSNLNLKNYLVILLVIAQRESLVIWTWYIVQADIALRTQVSISLSHVLFSTVSIEFFTVTPTDFGIYYDMLKNHYSLGLLYKKVFQINS